MIKWLSCIKFIFTANLGHSHTFEQLMKQTLTVSKIHYVACSYSKFFSRFNCFKMNIFKSSNLFLKLHYAL